MAYSFSLSFSPPSNSLPLSPLSLLTFFSLFFCVEPTPNTSHHLHSLQSIRTVHSFFSFLPNSNQISFLGPSKSQDLVVGTCPLSNVARLLCSALVSTSTISPFTYTTPSISKRRESERERGELLTNNWPKNTLPYYGHTLYLPIEHLSFFATNNHLNLDCVTHREAHTHTHPLTIPFAFFLFFILVFF